MKSARAETSTTFSKIIIASAKNSSDGIRLQQCSVIRASEPPVAVAVLKKMAEEAKKTAEDTPQSTGADSGPLVHAGFDDRLSSRLLPSYTEPPISVDDVSHS